MWLFETEGATFWMSVLTELQNRGLQDIIIARVEGLSDFPDAINNVFPPGLKFRFASFTWSGTR